MRLMRSIVGYKREKKRMREDKTIVDEQCTYSSGIFSATKGSVEF